MQAHASHCNITIQIVERVSSF